MRDGASQRLAAICRVMGGGVAPWKGMVYEVKICNMFIILDLLGNPVEGERDSGLKLNAIPL